MKRCRVAGPNSCRDQTDRIWRGNEIVQVGPDSIGHLRHRRVACISSAEFRLPALLNAVFERR